MNAHSSNINGFTLIEVLVSIVITSIGVLGVASLQFHGVKSTLSSYELSQAVLASSDLIERMKLNLDSTYSGDYVIDDNHTIDDDRLNKLGLKDWYNSLNQSLPGLTVRLSCSSTSGTGNSSACPEGSLHRISLLWSNTTTCNKQSQDKCFELEIRL